MSPPDAFEPRRRKELLAALLERARIWMPDWQPRPGGMPDLAQASFEIAARLGSEVTQRLNRAPDRALRDFYHWLGMRGRAGRAARIPVIFNVTPGAPGVRVERGVQLQATDIDPPVVFETERALQIVAGRLVALVAADPQSDRFFVPPPAPLSLEGPKPVPDEWIVKSAGSGGSAQLEPSVGIEVGLIVADEAGQHHEVVAFDNGVATLKPPLAAVAAADGGEVDADRPRVFRVATFDAFDPLQVERQRHRLYVGDDDALDIATAALIEVRSEGALPSDLLWEYWGRRDDRPADEAPDWHKLEPKEHEGRRLLLKPAGTVEKTLVQGQTKAKRWLRATRSSGFDRSTEVGRLQLLVNCFGVMDDELKKKLGIKDAPSTPPVCEGIANTSPQVLDAPFYPLGREPRQFDAFHLGCAEAFSKTDARVKVTFKIGDAFSEALVAVRGPNDAERWLFGIGRDGKLRHVLLRTADNAKERISFEASKQPVDGQGRSIALSNDGVRPAVQVQGNVVYVLGFERASGGPRTAWLYTQRGSDAGDWQELQALQAPEETDPKLPLCAVLVQPAVGKLRAYAVHLGRVWHCDPLSPGTWIEEEKIPAMTTKDGKPDPLVAIVAVSRPDKLGETYEADGLLLLWKSGRTASWRGAGTVPTSILPDAANEPIAPLSASFLFDAAIEPIAVKTSTDVWVVARTLDGGFIALPRSDATKYVKLPREDIRGDLAAHSFGFDLDNDGSLVVLYLVKVGYDLRLANWRPVPGGKPVLDPVPFARESDEAGSPLAIGRYQVIPGVQGRVHVRKFERKDSKQGVGEATLAAMVDEKIVQPPFEPYFVDVTKGTVIWREIIDAKRVIQMPEQPRALLLDRTPAKRNSKGTLYRRQGVAYTGTSVDRKLELDGKDYAPLKAGDILCIARILTDNDKDKVRFHKVVHDVPETAPRIAELDPRLPTQGFPEGSSVSYTRVRALQSDVPLLPALDIKALAGTSKPTLMAGTFEVDGAQPAVQRAQHVSAALDWVVFKSPWTKQPVAARVGYTFMATAAEGAWARYTPPLPNNPALSWEYWDGTGWWQIDDLTDGTGNLVKTGNVVFCVPRNLQPTDVVGHNNHWIRARLVGGDYGREAVIVRSEQSEKDGITTTTQTIDRNIDLIRAPYVLDMTVAYSVCCPVTPDAIVTEDNGASLDQTDANRTSGAVVEAFVPLALSLARLGNLGEEAPAAGSQPTTAPACVDCTTGKRWPDDAPAGGVGKDQAQGSDGGKALYLGFDAPLRGGPVSLLFLVDERDHDGAYPLRVDVLRRNGFEPLVVEDQTRGLNESGVVTLTLAEPPTQTQLFGHSLYWLRLRPRAGFLTDWAPAIRGAWLNATWAEAAETQSLELLGSSDGSPRQRVALARPPVIAQSLELRVRERLGDEDIDALRKNDPDKVTDVAGNRPGPWVRWNEVRDTDDAGARDRVYALDDATGEIRFGDGRRGRIPPIGRDAILAVQYRRGGGAAANDVRAWSQINLVTPVQDVRGVAVPQDAAGGSDPQDAAATLRFAPDAVWLRERVVTLRDLEVLALQSSADIAQVRALPARVGVRLVVAMRGHDLRPSEAVRRELKRVLLAMAPPSLALPDALVIERPLALKVRIDLGLAIDAIEHSGAVAEQAEKRIKALLDPASGGLDGRGWPLGELPSNADVAACLFDIAHVEEVRAVAAHAVTLRGKSAPLPASLRPAQLVVLSTDGVRCAFSVFEPEAVA